MPVAHFLEFLPQCHRITPTSPTLMERLDGEFYDVDSIDDNTEAPILRAGKVGEGCLLRVPPACNAGPTPLPLAVFHTVGELRASQQAEGWSSRVLTVAGVGSSALGGAALARNVADALETEYVVAVVAGNGLADVLQEAAGGFFWFGALNRWRTLADDQALNRPVTPWQMSMAAVRNMLDSSVDTRTLCELLTQPDLDWQLLLGHSKGNLLISEALYALPPARLQALGAQVDIVTVSARVFMPEACQNVQDVMGSLDVLGEMNSRSHIKTDLEIPGAGHTTNRKRAGALDVEDIVRKLRDQKKIL